MKDLVATTEVSNLESVAKVGWFADCNVFVRFLGVDVTAASFACS